jgi:hypothetical protein
VAVIGRVIAGADEAFTLDSKTIHFLLVRGDDVVVPAWREEGMICNPQRNLASHSRQIAI